MEKKEIIEEMVDEVLDEFDFDKVHDIMVQLDWKWYIGAEECEKVPSVYSLIKHAKRLLHEVALENFGKTCKGSMSSGGFLAVYEEIDDTRYLELLFVLEQSMSEVDIEE